MKSSTLLAVLFVTASSLTLSGCAHRHGPGHDHHASSSANAMGHGGKMDRAAMCEKYGKMTLDERKTHVEAHHGKMTPEMLQQHEKMMQDRCSGN